MAHLPLYACRLTRRRGRGPDEDHPGGPTAAPRPRGPSDVGRTPGLSVVGRGVVRTQRAPTSVSVSTRRRTWLILSFDRGQLAGSIFGQMGSATSQATEERPGSAMPAATCATPVTGMLVDNEIISRPEPRRSRC